MNMNIWVVCFDLLKNHEVCLKEEKKKEKIKKEKEKGEKETGNCLLRLFSLLYNRTYNYCVRV